MLKSIIVCFILVFTFADFAPASSADETVHGWKYLSKRNFVDVKRSAQADRIYASVNLRTSDPDRPELRFTCSEEYGLRATLLLQPLSEGALDGGKSVRARARFTRLSVEGREPERMRWVHVKEVRALQTASSRAARMIYNAAVQGRTFTVKEPFKGEVLFDMPPVDDAFRKFSKACGVTNGEN